VDGPAPRRMAGTVPGWVAFAAVNAVTAAGVGSSCVARYSQAAWVTNSQAHRASAAATSRAPPQASGTARGRRQASARAAEQRARATSRRSARAPTTTSARKLLPPLRRAAMHDGWRRVPSQLLAWLAPPPWRRAWSTPGRAWGPAPPEAPLLALACAAWAQARASASTSSLLVRRPASTSREVGSALVTQVVSSEAKH